MCLLTRPGAELLLGCPIAAFRDVCDQRRRFIASTEASSTEGEAGSAEFRVSETLPALLIERTVAQLPSRSAGLRLLQVFCRGIPRLPGVGKAMEGPPRFIRALLPGARHQGRAHDETTRSSWLPASPDFEARTALPRPSGPEPGSRIMRTMTPVSLAR